MRVMSLAVAEDFSRVPSVLPPSAAAPPHALAEGVTCASLDGILGEAKHAPQRLEPARTDVDAKVILLVVAQRLFGGRCFVCHRVQPAGADFVRKVGPVDGLEVACLASL